MPFYGDERVGPYVVYNIQSEESRNTRSYSNVREAKFAVLLYKYLRSKYPELNVRKESINFEIPGRVGVITPYRQQLDELRKQFRLEKFEKEIELSTVVFDLFLW